MSEENQWIRKTEKNKDIVAFVSKLKRKGIVSLISFRETRDEVSQTVSLFENQDGVAQSMRSHTILKVNNTDKEIYLDLSFLDDKITFATSLKYDSFRLGLSDVEELLPVEFTNKLDTTWSRPSESDKLNRSLFQECKITISDAWSLKFPQWKSTSLISHGLKIETEERLLYGI
jgi:hypothetical protein